MTHHLSSATAAAVFAGIDTHADFHHVAVVDADGHKLGDQAFPTTVDGYAQAASFLTSWGHPARTGIEGTASYGAAISHLLAAADHTVIEVNRPDRRARRAAGKSDPADAYAAADAVRTSRASTLPKLSSGTIEALRLTTITRRSAVKARTQTINQIRSIIRSAPAALADSLRGLPLTELITRLTRWRADTTNHATLPATKTALTRLARRWTYLTEEISAADHTITELTSQIAPELLAIDYVGPHTAAQLLITAGSNPDRLHHEASFARLTGVAPIPASSGRTRRHRLHRGGDRQANHALWRIAFNRCQHHPPTQAYLERRRQQQLSDKEILRCLKRYLIRELLPAIRLAIQRQHTH